VEFSLEVEVIHRVVLAVHAIKIIVDGGRRKKDKFAIAAVILRIVGLLSLPVMTSVQKWRKVLENNSTRYT